MGCGSSTQSSNGKSSASGGDPAWQATGRDSKGELLTGEEREYYLLQQKMQEAYAAKNWEFVIEQTVKHSGLAIEKDNLGQGPRNADSIPYLEAVVKYLLKTGNVIPCEANGPYHISLYHRNVEGEYRGFASASVKKEYIAKQMGIFDRQVGRRGWPYLGEALDRTNLSIEFAFQCEINGKSITSDMASLKRLVNEARFQMSSAFVDGLNHALRRDEGGRRGTMAKLREAPEFAESTYNFDKPRQTGVTDMLSLYKQAITALPGLWAICRQALEACGDPGVYNYGTECAAQSDGRTYMGPSWGVKKPLRVWAKVSGKYDGDFGKVTDVARCTIVFNKLEYLGNATLFLLKHPQTVFYKNRNLNPTREQYHDMLFNVNVSGHICEIQLEVADMVAAKSKVHWMYKVCRLIPEDMQDESWWAKMRYARY